MARKEAKRATAIIIDLGGAPQVSRPIALLERRGERRMVDPTAVRRNRRGVDSLKLNPRAALGHLPAWQARIKQAIGGSHGALICRMAFRFVPALRSRRPHGQLFK